MVSLIIQSSWNLAKTLKKWPFFSCALSFNIFYESVFEKFRVKWIALTYPDRALGLSFSEPSRKVGTTGFIRYWKRYFTESAKRSYALHPILCGRPIAAFLVKVVKSIITEFANRAILNKTLEPKEYTLPIWYILILFGNKAHQIFTTKRNVSKFFIYAQNISQIHHHDHVSY